MSCCLTKPKQGKRMAQKSQGGGQIHTVESESDSDVFAFILKTSDKSSDKVTVSLRGHPVEFVLDSGASANIIDKQLHQNIADALSRLVENKPIENSRPNSVETEQYVKFIAREATPHALSTREVEEVSKRDEELFRIRRFIKEGEWEKSCVDYFPFKDELCSIVYLVLRRSRIMIPISLRKQCV
uniref:Peptidase A2 domain-containing protein n=1 Tax=Magallana gigas TaxID=29159 RepID=A0A8W8MHL2_MAGGI